MRAMAVAIEACHRLEIFTLGNGRCPRWNIIGQQVLTRIPENLFRHIVSIIILLLGVALLFHPSRKRGVRPYEFFPT
jgi:hypothetical protein